MKLSEKDRSIEQSRKRKFECIYLFKVNVFSVCLTWEKKFFVHLRKIYSKIKG